jgi:hypothetical protein
VEEQRYKESGVELAEVIVEIYYTPKGIQENWHKFRGEIYTFFLEKYKSGWKIGMTSQPYRFDPGTDSSTGQTPSDKNAEHEGDGKSSPAPTQSQEVEIYTYKDYPRNPKSPGEVVAAVVFLSDALFRGEISVDEYLELYPKSLREQVKKEFLEMSKLPEPRGWKEIRILNVETSEDERHAEVTFSAVLESGPAPGTEVAHCVKENGEWKVETVG